MSLKSFFIHLFGGLTQEEYYDSLDIENKKWQRRHDALQDMYNNQFKLTEKAKADLTAAQVKIVALERRIEEMEKTSVTGGVFIEDTSFQYSPDDATISLTGSNGGKILIKEDK